MDNFTPITATIGGTFIGLAAALMYSLHGRITGISGIIGSTLTSSIRTNFWRVLFLLGILAGALLGKLTNYSVPSLEITPSWPLLISGGLLVGIGTTIGSGCTSGHGVCGVARLSKRSVVATLLFMIAAFIVVRLRYHGV